MAGQPVAGSGAWRTLGALFSVGLFASASSAMSFLGPVRDDYPHTPHDPGPGLWAAPAFLALLVILSGLMPDDHRWAGWSKPRPAP